ncbi:MAG: M56 family metallopeptidase [Planctomycetota bacterium]
MNAAEVVHGLAGAWWELAAATLTEGTAVLAIALLLWLPVRRRAPAQLGYLVFLAVLLRMVLPWHIELPAAMAAASPANWLSSWTPAAAEVSAPPLTASLALPHTPLEGAQLVEVEIVGMAAPAATERADAGAQVPWVIWGFGVWAAIALFLAARHVRARRRTARMARAAVPAEGEILGDFEDLCRRVGMRRPTRLMISDRISAPAAGGLTAPYVLLPRGLAPRLSRNALRWVLLHELAHLRRGDLVCAVLQDAASILFFFHPGVWLVNRLVDEHRELACDETARAVSGASRRACGDGFLRVVEWTQQHRLAAPGALAMFKPQDPIRRRLMHLVQPRPRSRMNKLCNSLFAIAAALVVIPSAPATPGLQDPDRETGKIERLEQKLQELEQRQADLRSRLKRLRRSGRGHGEGHGGGHGRGRGEGHAEGHSEGHGSGHGRWHGEGHGEGQGRGRGEGHSGGHGQGHGEGHGRWHREGGGEGRRFSFEFGDDDDGVIVLREGDHPGMFQVDEEGGFLTLRHGDGGELFKSGKVLRLNGNGGVITLGDGSHHLLQPGAGVRGKVRFFGSDDDDDDDDDDEGDEGDDEDEHEGRVHDRLIKLFHSGGKHGLSLKGDSPHVEVRRFLRAHGHDDDDDDADGDDEDEARGEFRRALRVHSDGHRGFFRLHTSDDDDDDEDDGDDDDEGDDDEDEGPTFWLHVHGDGDDDDDDDDGVVRVRSFDGPLKLRGAKGSFNLKDGKTLRLPHGLGSGRAWVLESDGDEGDSPKVLWFNKGELHVHDGHGEHRYNKSSKKLF